MENQELLEKFSPYLPYGLTAHAMGEFVDEDEETPTIFNITALSKHWVTVNGGFVQFPYAEVFPILRPLSDMKQKIKIDWTDIGGMEFSRVQQLIENHFDIHDLIGQGKAIDINTLK